jgi:peptide deformylase
MAVREVLRYPHPSLKRVAAEADLSDQPTIRRVTKDLVDTVRWHQGCVGLAATQLDEMARVIAVDVTGHRKATTSNGLLVLVNPSIVSALGSEIAREGCLSIPELTANVRRATEIVVDAHDPDGDRIGLSSLGFEARCIQHELDHLDGILFLDRVASLERDVFRRKRK